jgi:pheromone shutdown protein TraB
MNAQQLFSKMLKSMSVSEKLKLLLTGLGGFFVSKQRVEKELARFEKDFDAYIEQIGEKLPTIKRVLIDERNEYMTQQLVEINTHYNKVVALVGDGHIVGISQLLTSKDVTFETIRLQELRNQKPYESDSTTASFTTEYGF